MGNEQIAPFYRAFALLALIGGCNQSVVIGADAPGRDGGAVDASTADSGLTPIPFPWSTGFENGYADYQAAQGFCYFDGGATFSIVSAPAPVHSGTHSIEFTVSTVADGAESQTRCVLQGVLPASAYYGAWYYVPAAATNFGNWNLIHFLGGAGPAATATQHGLWDVSLVNEANGALHASVYDFLRSETPDAGAVPPIPIATWFHLEVYLQRAADGTGRFTLYQDGALAVDLTGINTDDTAWGQFFVGNLATSLVPSVVSVYVDDITVSPTP